MDNDKIGNYIHWKYTNYLKYGTGTKEHPKDIISIKTKALEDQRNLVLNESKLKKNINKKLEKDKLENQLNFFFNRNSNTKQLVKGISNEDLHRSIIKKIQERFGDLVQIDENLKATISDAAMSQKYGKLKENASYNSVVAVYNRIAYIKKYIDSFIAPKLLEGKGLSRNQTFIQNSFNDVAKMFQESIDLSDRTFSELLGDAKISNFDPALIKTIELEKEEIHNKLGQIYTRTKMQGGKIFMTEGLIPLLNEVIKRINKANAAYYTGLAGEMYVALVTKIGSNKAITEVNKLLADFSTGLVDNNLGLVGQNTTYSAMNKQAFAVSGKTNDNYFTSFDGKNSISLKATQDKVDVVITLDNGELLNASVKNYNLSDPLKNITLLSGTNMLKYLSAYQTFVNHYLNIVSQSLSEPRNESDRSFREQIPQSLIIEANKTLLLTLTLKALAGGVEKLSLDQSGFIKNDMAEVFILNDNSTGQFKVFFIEDIINKIGLNYSKIIDYIDMDNFSENFRPGMYWITQYKNGVRNYSDAYSRINNLLNSFVSQRLNISLKQTVLS